MDIPIPDFVPHPDKIYYKEVLLKKEARKTWTQYYAVLCDRFLIFNGKDPKGDALLPNNYTIIELTPHSTIAYSRKRCHRFPFYIKTNKLTYYCKCETNLQRYRWVHSLRLAVEGKAPEPPPKFVPTGSLRDNRATKNDDRRRYGLKHQSLHASNGNLSTNTGYASSRSRIANGGRCHSHENILDMEDENELNHSSTAVRLHKNKHALLLTNKNAFITDEQSTSFVVNRHRARRLSNAKNDLKLEDFDDEDHVKDSDDPVIDASIKKLHVSADQIESSTDPEPIVSGRTKPATEAYRLYPGNMKSYSWTFLGVPGKTPVTRQHSAPPSSKRHQKPPRQKVTFDANTK